MFNGKILLSSRLSMAIQWFAGGSSYDIALNHDVNYQEMMKSVWTVVDLVNLCFWRTLLAKLVTQ